MPIWYLRYDNISSVFILIIWQWYYCIIRYTFQRFVIMMTLLTFLKYTHLRWPRLYSGCCSHNPVHLPSFMTYRGLSNMHNTTGYMYYKSSSFSLFRPFGLCIVCFWFRALNTIWYFHGYVPPIVNNSRLFHIHDLSPRL